MALTQITTKGIKDGTILGADLTTNVDLVDNQKIRFGTGNDLQIYHSGSHSFIKNSGTGVLHIQGNNSNDLKISPRDDEDSIIAKNNGSVELYHNGSKKFETMSTGAYVEGYLAFPDNGGLKIGSGNDLQIFHNGSHSFIRNSGTGVLHIQGNNSNDLKISPRDDEDSIVLKNNGAVQLYHNNSKKFETTSQGANLEGNGSDHYILDLHNTGSGKGSQIQFRNDHDASANIGITGDTTGDLRVYTEKTFKVQHGSEIGIKSIINGAVELYHNGIKMIETTSTGTSMPDGKFAKFGNNDDMSMGHNTENFITYTGASLRVTGDGINDIQLMPVSNERSARFIPNGAVELYHNNSKKLETTSSGVTVLGTVIETSDIALKSNIQPLTNTLEKIQQITGYKYNFINSTSSSMGVIAQDVEKVFPELVHGSEGNKTLQYSGLIGVLVEAVKDLSAKVASLEAT